MPSSGRIKLWACGRKPCKAETHGTAYAPCVLATRACLRRSESSGAGQDVGHVEEGHVEDVEEGHVEHEHVEDGAAQAQGARARACVRCG